jgi:molybdopterin-guanine dinucleotide biosynthesis protein A
MGGDKPLRPWGGTTLIGAALSLARLQTHEVAVVVRRQGQAGWLEAPVVFDAPGIEGPLAGLAAALRHARDLGCDAVLTLPCDMPRLPADLAERLLAALAADPGALAALPRTDTDLHPVCAVWRVEALDRLPAYLAGGQRSLRGFAKSCGAAVAAWRDPALFANANTPEDLARISTLTA